ncbi:pilin [Patescibacteria group bacterium]|nr:pilin [Patescibacteria group bacterium]
MNKSYIKVIAIALIAVFGFALVAPTALATTAPSISNSLNTVQKYSGLRGGDLPTFVATIVKWILGLVGIILVAMFVYGGVMYATSAGNDERVETGKKIMIYAIIGTVIIVVAFIATDYIVNALFASETTGSAF